jgi:hypothetical protein
MTLTGRSPSVGILRRFWTHFLPRFEGPRHGSEVYVVHLQFYTCAVGQNGSLTVCSAEAYARDPRNPYALQIAKESEHH